MDIARGRRLAADGTGRRVRQEAGLSLAELAAGIAELDDRAAITAAAVHKWERGVRRPRGRAAAAYAHLIDALQATAQETQP